ncbi:MAG: hypothetical protein GY832_47475 [Chloroflexi bacterium]|nr:hypothetical protein [Chloroflexota bacterium]
MLGIQDADHEESTPKASKLLISQLSCSLVGESEQIDIEPGTLVHQVYGKIQVVERYTCNYGLNPEYRERIGRGMLKVVGRNAEGAIRVVELEGHRFFVASLFLPQMSSTRDRPSPMLIAYLRKAAMGDQV